MTMVNVLIADGNAEAREGIRKILQSDKDFVVIGEAVDGEDCINKAANMNPDLIVMDTDLPILDGIQACSTIVEANKHISVIFSIQQPTVEQMQSCINAGGRGILIKPYNTTDLLSAVRRTWSQSPVEKGNTIKAPGKITAVYASKGGLGVSIIAVNLAVAYAVRRTAEKTVLLDFDVHYGCDSLMLNLPPVKTVADFVQEVVKNEDVLSDYILTHRSGLHLLPAPLRPEYGDLVNGTEARNILSISRHTYDNIIVDVSSKMNEVSLVALEQCDTIILVCSTDVVAVNNTKKALDILKELRLLGKVKLLLNRANVSNVGIAKKEIESALKFQISYLVPSDGKITVNSINTGNPFVLANPNSEISKCIYAIMTEGQAKGVKA